MSSTPFIPANNTGPLSFCGIHQCWATCKDKCCFGCKGANFFKCKMGPRVCLLLSLLALLLLVIVVLLFVPVCSVVFIPGLCDKSAHSDPCDDAGFSAKNPIKCGRVAPAPSPIRTKAPSPIEAPSPPSPKHICQKSGPLDIVLVMDGSESVGHSQFMEELNFLKDITSKMHLGPQYTRVALVQYSDSFNVEFNFIDNESDLKSAFEAVEHQNGGTRTGQAIRFAYKNVIKNHARSYASVKMVVVTDGFSEDQPKRAANEMRANGVEMVAVGFTQNQRIPDSKQCTMDSLFYCELTDIANKPSENFVFMGGNGNRYKSLIEGVTYAACDDRK